MIKKDFMIKKETKNNRNSNHWILQRLNNNQCQMKTTNQENEKIILLINPLVIKGGATVYGLDGRNKFENASTLAFGSDTEKPTNPKLDKKNKKIIKKDDDTNENVNTKSKLKLKRKIEGGYDDSQRIKKQGTNNKKGRKAARKRDTLSESLIEKPEEVFLSNPLSVQELAGKICVSETEIIKTLFLDGVIVNINQVLDIETAITIGDKLGVKVIASEEEVKNPRNDFSVSDSEEKTEKRPPIIAIMGHVDHGKTTLLDKIRQTQIAQKEAGGITQKIGAYEVELDYQEDKRKLVFLDTPGHEAFSSMRSRGIQVTDIGVLVVAADDGVKPQTVETIKCIKDAGIPLIVAINKIDKDDANIENIKQELSKYNLIPDDWGGDIPMIPISAKEGTNMDELLDMMVLVSDMLDLRASVEKNGIGTILEANLDKSKGAIATLLVQNGVLEVGDFIVTSQHAAKIRGMVNCNNEKVNQSMPSSPVLVWGLTDVPNIGDKFEAFKSEKEAKSALQVRQNEVYKTQKINSTSDKYSLLNSSVEAVINLVIKTDIQGSVEAIISSIEQVEEEKVKVRVLYASPGEITETDVDFADASNSTILAFNTSLAPGAKKTARHLGVQIKEYNVIYDLFDDIQTMVDDIIGPQYEEKKIGEASVKAVFPLGKNYVAGSFVSEGKIIKGCHVKVYRNGVQVHEGLLSSLKQFKQDVTEIEQDSECGIYIEEFDDWQENDVISAFELIEKKRNR